MKRRMRSGFDPDGFVGIGGVVVVAVTLCVSPSEAGDWRRVDLRTTTCTSSVGATLIALVPNPNFTEPSLYHPILTPPFSPKSGAGNASPLIRASLAFVVSVCLDNVDYSIACRERSLLEAARRLEQIYLETYRAKRVAGSLKIWFALAVEYQEQLRFLREVEDRAIKAVESKLQDVVDAQRLRNWRDAATGEARNGSNWLHAWSARNHEYRPGAALYQLAHINM
jgi:hypothetical protein